VQVAGRRAGRQHHHHAGVAVREGAQATAELDAVQPGQAEVEHDQRERLGLQRLPGGRAIPERDHAMAALGDHLGDQRAQVHVVLDQQHAQGAVTLGLRPVAHADHGCLLVHRNLTLADARPARGAARLVRSGPRCEDRSH